MTTELPAGWQGRLRSPAAAWAALAAITALAAVLRFTDLGRAGLANLFYAAAVRSQGLSLHNFLYAAFDPVGTLTVDKPPLGLWAQVLSTKLFGYGGVPILLPMALAGTVAVPLVFGGARRSHGVAAGLAAAAVLAVFPESVATARDSTMDALMMALLAGGAWLLVAAVESRRTDLLIAWGALMGIVFNVKFFEGFIILPAATLYVAVRWRGEWRAHVRPVALATAAMVVIALSWVTFVQLTPASHRPLVMNDPSNSAYGLVLRYNGIERVLPGQVTIFEPAVNTPIVVEATKLAAHWYGVGDAGPLRLFHDPKGALLGVTVLLALFGVAMAAWRRRDWLDGPGTLWSAWFLTGAVLFTFSNRSAAQYTESYAPALAVMAGVGLVEGWRARDGWRAAVLPAALIAVAAFGWWAVSDEAVLQRGTRLEAAATAGIALIALVATALGDRVRSRHTLRLLPVVAVLGIPLTASLWIARYAPHSGQITRPNPLVYASRDAPGLQTRLVPAEALLRAADALGAAHTRYAFAIDGINNAGEAIAYTGASVLPIWNEYRREPVLPPAQLDALLRAGEVPLMALSRERIATGELDAVMPVIERDCRQAPARGASGWSVWRCDPAAASP